MRIFKTKEFARFARKQKISDAVLKDAVARAEAGTVDADLGSGVIKQRVARPGQGRRGGFRVIVFYRSGDRAIFVDGFAKGERDNIDDDELVAFRKAARLVLDFADDKIKALLESDSWTEIGNA